MLADESWGLDFESEVCVILGDTPQGTRADGAGRHVKLLLLANDVTLRNLVPNELAKSFGFFQSKPATAFSPFAVTPDELGDAWRGGRVHLRAAHDLQRHARRRLRRGAEMHFSFHELIAHIAKTRAFTAGTIVGSGTVSNADRARGISLPRRAPHDRDDRERQADDAVHEGRRLGRHRDARRRRLQSLFGTIAQKVVS